MELDLVIAEDWSVAYGDGTDAEIKHFPYPGGETTIEILLKQKAALMTGPVIALQKEQGGVFSLGAKMVKLEILGEEGVFAPVSSGLMDIEDFIRQFSISELEKLHKKKAKKLMKQHVRLDGPVLESVWQK